LKLAAGSPHWRNTWLLAAGKLLVSSDRFESVLVNLLRAIAQSSHMVDREAVAPGLAADMLADGLTQRRPGFERAVAQMVLSVRDHAPVAPLQPIAAALNGLMDAGYRETVTNYLGAAAGFPQRATTGALLDVMTQLLDDDEAGRRQSIRLAREHLDLSEAEEAALAAFLSLTDPPARQSELESAATSTGGQLAVPSVPVGLEMPVKDALLAGLVEIDADGNLAARIGEGLSVLDSATYALTQSEPQLAVLRSMPGVDSAGLLGLLADEDLATALDLALGGLGDGYWSLPALVSRSARLGHSRRRVGNEIAALVGSPDA
jgi:hypothetical protein